MIENLNPKEVFKAFELISAIPHGSFNTDAISAFLENYAKERGLFCIRDEHNNIIIVKEASKGYEASPSIIIQGHMDMVCISKPEVDFDFEASPIKLCVDGDRLYADGTSLGGDDGIAVAYAMALLDTDAPHPRLEILITSDEEVGMIGASNCDLSVLKGRQMINIDTGRQGYFITGCAGGTNINCNYSLPRENDSGTFITVNLTGLHGGHSGAEIHMEYANAIKIIAQMLGEACKSRSIKLCSLYGGQKDNAIPNSCTAAFLCSDENTEDILRSLSAVFEKIKEEYRASDPNMKIDIASDAAENISCFTPDSTENILFLLEQYPHGVLKLSSSFKNTVDTSVNLGICSAENGSFSVTFLVRSLLNRRTDHTVDIISSLTEKMGGTWEIVSSYPAWENDSDTDFCRLMAKTYSDMTAKEPNIEVLHAGLECGVLKNGLAGLQCVSIGPNQKNIHTPEEEISISSVEFTWRYILEVLRRCK